MTVMVCWSWRWVSVGGQAVVSALFQLDFIPVFPFHHREHLIVNVIEADVLWNIFLPLKMSCSTVSDAWTVGRGIEYLLQAAQIHMWGTPGLSLASSLANKTKIRIKYNWEDVSPLWIGCFYFIPVASFALLQVSSSKQSDLPRVFTQKHPQQNSNELHCLKLLFYL